MINLDNARVVTLEPSTGETTVTFEEAFGEHSELRGRGRARRQARRQARRMKRISNRAERKRARQSMRAEQQEARQLRKDTRKSRRVQRKAMGDEPEEQETSSAPVSTDDQSGDYSQDNLQSTSSDDENQTSGDEESQDGGEVSEQDEESTTDAETTDENSSFDAETRSNPVYDDLTRRIQSNLQIIQKTNEQLTNIEAMLKSRVASDVMARLLKKRTELKATLQARTERVRELQGKLESFSEARGRRGFGRGRGMGHGFGKKFMAKHPKLANRVHKTPVDESLGAKFSENRIEVPADEHSNFGGKAGEKSKIVPVVLGLALAGLVIYGINHYSKTKKA